MKKLKIILLILSCVCLKASHLENLCIEFLNCHRKSLMLYGEVDKDNVLEEMHCLFPIHSRADYVSSLEELVRMIPEYKLFSLQSKQKSAPHPETATQIILVLLEQYR